MHFDYEKAIYNKLLNVTFSNRIKSVRYNAALAVAEAMKGGSHENLRRTSHLRYFVKKGVLKIFANFHRKTPVLESPFNKVADLQVCNFIKRRLQHKCFPGKICEIFKNIFMRIRMNRMCSFYKAFQNKNSQYKIHSLLSPARTSGRQSSHLLFPTTRL